MTVAGWIMCEMIMKLYDIMLKRIRVERCPVSIVIMVAVDEHVLCSVVDVFACCGRGDTIRSLRMHAKYYEANSTYHILSSHYIVEQKTSVQNNL